MPLCHGAEKSRLGSNEGDCWPGVRFFSTFGIALLSKSCR